MQYWKCDLATGDLATSPDGSTWTDVAGLLWWKLAVEWDTDTKKFVVAVHVKVQDSVSTNVVNAQGAGSFVLSSGYIPTREFRSAHVDTVAVFYNGVEAGAIGMATGFPNGPLSTRSLVDDPFKSDV